MTPVEADVNVGPHMRQGVGRAVGDRTIAITLQVAAGAVLSMAADVVKAVLVIVIVTVTESEVVRGTVAALIRLPLVARMKSSISHGRRGRC